MNTKNDVYNYIQSKDNISPFVAQNLIVKTKQTPGMALFENYDQLKQAIESGVAYYQNYTYSLDNYYIALKHRDEIKYVKGILEKSKNEIIKNYNQPLETIKQKLDELINLIKVPYKKIDLFIKENEKNIKKQEIYVFAKNFALENGLIDYFDEIFLSPAFFDAKWLNISCSKSSWQSAVCEKLNTIAKDIKQILLYADDQTPVVLACYFQTLSMDKVSDFVVSLNSISSKDVFANKAPQSSNVCNQQKTNVVAHRLTDLKDFEVVRYVSNAINPYTSETLKGIDEQLREKLMEISIKLEKCFVDSQKNFAKKQHDTIHSNVGKLWTKEEELQLVDEYNRGLSIVQMAKIHNRKTGGINRRLKKLKLID